MASDEIVWQVINQQVRNPGQNQSIGTNLKTQFCSFKLKYGRQTSSTLTLLNYT